MKKKPVQRKRDEGLIKNAADFSPLYGHDVALFGATQPAYGIWDYLYAQAKLRTVDLSEKLRTAMSARLPTLRTYICKVFLGAVDDQNIPLLESLVREVKTFQFKAPARDLQREKILRMRVLLEARGQKMTIGNLAIFIDALKREDMTTLDKIVRALKAGRLHIPLEDCASVKSQNSHSNLIRICRDLGFPLAKAKTGRPKKALK